MACPRFSVVVVAYADEDRVERCIDSLLNQSLGREAYELCIVENRPMPRIRSKYAELVDSWVACEQNLGASGGRNLGVATTAAPILCFIDDDGVADHQFLASMDEAFERHPHAAAIRGRIEPLHYPYVSLLVKDEYDLGTRERQCLLQLEGVTCVRRASFERVGGFAPGVYHGEGMLLTEKLLEADSNCELFYNPDAVLKHDFADGWWGVWLKGKRIARSKSGGPSMLPHAKLRQEFIDSHWPRPKHSFFERVRRYPLKRFLHLSVAIHRKLDALTSSKSN